MFSEIIHSVLSLHALHLEVPYVFCFPFLFLFPPYFDVSNPLTPFPVFTTTFLHHVINVLSFYIPSPFFLFQSAGYTLYVRRVVP